VILVGFLCTAGSLLTERAASAQTDAVDDHDRVINELRLKESEMKKLLTPAVFAALQRLEATRNAFLDARSSEQPINNAGQAREAESEGEDEDREWLDCLKKVEKGEPPNSLIDAGNFSDWDARLNDAYKAARKTLAEECPETPQSGAERCVSPEILVNTERAWLRYREAWVQMGAVRWPKIPPDKWRAWLTEERWYQLIDLSSPLIKP
jgi:uncharacterized protein YecT (DUF1311 family)